jgi:hypothetical protein
MGLLYRESLLSDSPSSWGQLFQELCTCKTCLHFWRITPTECRFSYKNGFSQLPTYIFLGALPNCEKWLLASSCLSVHHHGTTWLPLPPLNWATQFLTVAYDGACSPNVSVRMAWIFFSTVGGEGESLCLDVEIACRLTCFLSASVTWKDLQFSTWTDRSFQRHYRFHPRTSGSRSLHLSASPSPLMSFCKIWYLSIFQKSEDKIQISLKSDQSNWYFTWRCMYIYDNISLNSSWGGGGDISDKRCRENQNTHFVFSNFILKIVPYMRQRGKIW